MTKKKKYDITIKDVPAEHAAKVVVLCEQVVALVVALVGDGVVWIETDLPMDMEVDYYHKYEDLTDDQLIGGVTKP